MTGSLFGEFTVYINGRMCGEWMRAKLYYITRTYYPYQKTGGATMRTGAVKYLQECNFDVIVVMPNYNEREVCIDNNIIKTPFKLNKMCRLYYYFLQSIGFYEDYLDRWVKTTLYYLKNRITKDDVVFATSGGELGTIKLGSILAKFIGCKFIVNFRDPLDFSMVNGKKLSNLPHISRERVEYKYLKNSDLIITSSQVNQKSLQNKYPNLANKIINNYFGYINKIDLNLYEKNQSHKIRIAYVGSISKLQKPESLYQAYKQLGDSNLEIYFIGNTSNYKPLKNIVNKNVHFIGYLPHNDFLEFMIKNIDIGFVSLSSDYLGACVPSKIYEYINLGLPMIGYLPDGDGKDIINNNGYGLACNYKNRDELVSILKEITTRDVIQNFRNNILKDKDGWHMQEKIKDVYNYLEGL
jgi:glycosyltransferase involved in cell wall biosynthesis